MAGNRTSKVIENVSGRAFPDVVTKRSMPASWRSRSIADVTRAVPWAQSTRPHR